MIKFYYDYVFPLLVFHQSDLNSLNSCGQLKGHFKGPLMLNSTERFLATLSSCEIYNTASK